MELGVHGGPAMPSKPSEGRRKHDGEHLFDIIEGAA